MFLGDRLGHLAYSTLVHPGDTWEEMSESVETFAPAVKARVSPDAPYGLSLRISAASAETLTADPGERARFRRWLDDHDMYVYTVNAFPYGPFKGRVVMEQVYEPDWSTEDRVGYTMQVADILAEIIRTDGRAVDPDRAAGVPAQGDQRPRTSIGSPRTCSAWWRTSSSWNDGPAGGSSWRWNPSRPASSRPPRRPCATSRSTSGRRDGIGRLARLTGLPASEVAGTGPAASRRRVRHLPSVGPVRGHRRLAAAAASTPACRSSSSRRRPHSGCPR